ncbi:MAG: phosphoribosylaminoimidazolesuccinocarboxamide synthase [Candidatus Pelagibacterales bacterium]|jgi:phosphoribosylaminoimidazole-succinocarboxamide synthase|tara:strand:- start:3017 stop:3736 length:720 start_codon:yes stop_codon:yes gene_type:complete
MSKDKILYEGKAKTIIKGPTKHTLIQRFKDDATAYNKKKHKIFKGKGALNNKISEYIMNYLRLEKVPLSFIKRVNERDQLIKECEIIPIEFVVRNIITGSIAKKLDLKEGIKLKKPLLEYYYKEDSLDDPMISRDHVEAFSWASKSEIAKIDKLSLKINNSLSRLFKKKGLILVDFKLEFGRLKSDKTKIVLADEISPDSCRLWDIKTNQKLDKDVFRKGLGSLLTAYQEVASRLGIGH